MKLSPNRKKRKMSKSPPRPLPHQVQSSTPSTKKKRVRKPLSRSQQDKKNAQQRLKRAQENLAIAEGRATPKPKRVRNTPASKPASKSKSKRTSTPAQKDLRNAKDRVDRACENLGLPTTAKVLCLEFKQEEEFEELDTTTIHETNKPNPQPSQESSHHGVALDPNQEKEKDLHHAHNSSSLTPREQLELEQLKERNLLRQKENLLLQLRIKQEEKEILQLEADRRLQLQEQQQQKIKLQQLKMSELTRQRRMKIIEKQHERQMQDSKASVAASKSMEVAYGKHGEAEVERLKINSKADDENATTLNRWEVDDKEEADKKKTPGIVSVPSTATTASTASSVSTATSVVVPGPTRITSEGFVFSKPAPVSSASLTAAVPNDNNNSSNMMDTSDTTTGYVFSGKGDVLVVTIVGPKNADGTYPVRLEGQAGTDNCNVYASAEEAQQAYQLHQHYQNP